MTGRVRRTIVVVGSVVVLASIATFVLQRPSVPWGAASPAAGPGSEEVALPAPSALPRTDGDGSLDELPTEPDVMVGEDVVLEPQVLRVDCPAGPCELWRRVGDDPGMSVWRDEGEVVIVEGDRIVVLDAATGDERWSRELSEGDEPDARPRAWVGSVVAGDDTRLVVLARGRIDVLTRSGEVLLTAALPDLDPLRAWLTDELLFVLVGGDDGGADFELELAALDTATGAVRWRRDDLGMVYLPWPPDVSASDVVLIEDDGLVALDAETGEERYRLGPADQRWVYRHAAFAVIQPFESEIEGTASVHATADGRELVALTGRRVEAALEVDGLLVTIIGPFGEGAREAVVMDANGAVVWQRTIDDAVPQRNCCATVLDLDDGHVQLSAGPGAEVLEVEVVSGDARASEPSDRGRSGQDRYGRDLLGWGSGDRTRFWQRPGSEVEVEVRFGFVDPVLDRNGWAARGGNLVLHSMNDVLGVQLP
jgi:hypothetical protein